MTTRRVRVPAVEKKSFGVTFVLHKFLRLRRGATVACAFPGAGRSNRSHSLHGLTHFVTPGQARPRVVRVIRIVSGWPAPSVSAYDNCGFLRLGPVYHTFNTPKSFSDWAKAFSDLLY